MGTAVAAHIDALIAVKQGRRARLARKTLLDGADPLVVRAAEAAQRALEAARTITFEAAAKAYYEGHEASWKNAKHRQQFLNTLKTYVFPKIGKLPVADIDTGLVLKCIEPIWQDKTETANRTRSRIEAVLDWACARNYRRGDNPARWQGHLSEVLPARGKIRKTKHHAALPIHEVPAFMTRLREQQRNPSCAAYRFDSDNPRANPRFGCQALAVIIGALRARV
jgi:integrase